MANNLILAISFGLKLNSNLNSLIIIIMFKIHTAQSYINYSSDSPSKDKIYLIQQYVKTKINLKIGMRVLRLYRVDTNLQI